MAMTVRTNISAIMATNQLNRTQGSLSSSLGKISSGLRINRAADDAAGQAVAMRMNSDNTSLKQAMRNTNDGISLVQTAEGGLGELHNILVRMRELSVQASNETYNSTDRSMISTEMTQLRNEYARITTTANFNRISVLQGSDTTFNIQVGIHDNADNRININLSTLNATLGAVGLTSLSGTIATSGNLTAAQGNVSKIDAALSEIATRRSRLGAIQNRLENALSEVINYSENLSSV
jgi:flagellin